MTDAPCRLLLLVDDDEAKRYMLSTWLQRAGHTVVEAATGREALDLVVGPSWYCSNLPDNTAAVLILQPDGQLRRTSASPEQLVPAQRGGPVEIADRIAAGLLGPGDTTATASLTREEWLQLVPDSALAHHGSVLQHQQGVIGTGQRLQDLVELALSGCLLACLSVLDDEHHRQRESRNQSLKNALSQRREPHRDAEQNPRHVRNDHDQCDHRTRRPPIDSRK